MAEKKVFLAVFATALLLSSANAQDQCGGHHRKLFGKCWDFIAIPGPMIDPSEACCSEVRKINITCLCDKVIKPGLELAFDLQKCVHVLDKCGNPLKKGSKCGPYTVPPLA